MIPFHDPITKNWNVLSDRKTSVTSPIFWRAFAPPCPVVRSRQPEAVLLPGSTEEVQQIVKICNRHKVSYIVTVSSLIQFAYPSGPGTVILQMKRMNQIEEINVEDRYAVIQPGVRHGQLFTELMKVGLTYPVAAVGPGGSVLASCLFQW